VFDRIDIGQADPHHLGRGRAALVVGHGTGEAAVRIHAFGPFLRIPEGHRRQVQQRRRLGDGAAVGLKGRLPASRHR